MSLSFVIGLFILFFITTLFFNFFPFSGVVTADNATTSVTVLNTPPQWVVKTFEDPASSTTTPTNAGSVVTWKATAQDLNNEPYFLLICKSSSTPTANNNAPPECGGGSSDRWARSATTSSGNEATASYTTQASDPEVNAWFSYICDSNSALPKCNAEQHNGIPGSATGSPFEVNHRPSFTVFIDDSPTDPGGLVTWYSTSTDPDTSGTPDQVVLYVCKANDFTGSSCGAGGTFCVSATSTSNPSCSATLTTPLQDKNYNAFGFVIDSHGFAASGGAQGTDSVLTVSNVAPTISSTTISLLDTDGVGPLTLTVAEGETQGFKVKFTVSDNNSCLNASGGNEIASSTISVYRSGIGLASCQTSGDYNANRCYSAGASTTGLWKNVVCTQDAGSCSGSSDPTATWTCTFPLWFLADPTDTGSQFPSQNWLAAAKAFDDNSANSGFVEASSGNELIQFLAQRMGTTSIVYGGLEPGQQNDPLFATTTIFAVGNTGLDQDLSGNDLCPTYPSCSGNATSTIPTSEQKFATSTVSYASGTALATSTQEVELNVPKSTATSSPANRNIFWGIRVPSAITLAGDYTGVNTFLAVIGEVIDW